MTFELVLTMIACADLQRVYMHVLVHVLVHMLCDSFDVPECLLLVVASYPTPCANTCFFRLCSMHGLQASQCEHITRQSGVSAMSNACGVTMR